MEKTIKMSGKSHAAWANIVLIPVKQHFVCCGVLPVALSTFGGAAAAEFLHSPVGEWAMGITVPPVVTYGVMWTEQKIQNWRAQRAAQKQASVQECAVENAQCCACDHKTLTRKNYMKQTALGYVFYAAAHFLLPHHHDHGAEHGSDHHDHPHEHHQGCDHTHHDDKVIHFGKKPELSVR